MAKARDQHPSMRHDQAETQLAVPLRNGEAGVTLLEAGAACLRKKMQLFTIIQMTLCLGTQTDTFTAISLATRPMKNSSGVMAKSQLPPSRNR